MSMDFTNEEKRILKQVASSDILDLTSEASDPTEIWVDGDNGDDNNPGTEAEPLATFAAAAARVPSVLNRTYAIRLVGAGPYDGTADLGGYYYAGGQNRLYIVGEATTVVDSGTLTGFTNTNSNPFLLTDTSQSWTVDEHVTRFIRFTSGDAAGLTVTIIENDATTLRFAGLTSPTVPAIGDTFEIVEPGTTLNTTESLSGASPTPASTSSERDPGVFYVNLVLDADSSLLQTVGEAQFYGCRIDASLPLIQGSSGYPCDLTDIGYIEGKGWGLVAQSLYIRTRFEGVVSAQTVSAFINVATPVISIAAGRIRGPGAFAAGVRVNAGNCILGSGTAPTFGLGRLLIREAPGETFDDDTGVSVRPGATCYVGANCHIDVQAASGVGILVEGTCSVNEGSFDAHVDAPTRGIIVRGGGNLVISGGNGTNITTGGSNVGAIAVGNTPQLADTGGAGDFTANYNFVRDAATEDGSYARRVD